MKKILIILILVLGLCGCSNNSKEEKNSLPKWMEVMENNNYIIIDVRTKEEYSEVHIENAINIPYTEIDENVNLDKEKDILVYCRSGNRSSIASSLLNELGYTVYNMGAIDNIDLPKVNGNN